MRNKKLRLQHYIKHPDQLLMKGIERIQSSFEKHHTQWQILYAVHEKGNVHIDELNNLMQPYADPGTVNYILSKLKFQCIIFNAEDKITLTSNGLDFYKSCFKY